MEEGKRALLELRQNYVGESRDQIDEGERGEGRETPSD